MAPYDSYQLILRAKASKLATASCSSYNSSQFLPMQIHFPAKISSNLTLDLRVQSPLNASASPCRVRFRDTANAGVDRRKEGERLSLNSQCFKQNQGLTGPASQSTHQVDKVLVADPPLGVAVCQGQQDLQLVRV